ncbi:MAG: hypothetical protein AAFV86_24495, partial [Pseudomonadota bacterium]
DGLDGQLQAAVDEGTSEIGWTHDAPDGWSRSVDPDSPQGTTEWRGWSFVTPEFWQAADGQARNEFTKGTGVIAVADGDEWDDFNGGAAGNADSLDTTIGTPGIDLTGVGGGQTGTGEAAGVARIDKLDGDEAILVTPAATGQLTEYTLIFDLLIEAPGSSFTALYQTDVTNSGDAEIYFRDDGATTSFGILGDYDGAIEYGTWNRIAITLEQDGDAQVMHKYLNGAFLDSQQVDGDVTDGSRWSIDADTGFLLFSEPNGFTSELFTNAVTFTPDVLSEGEIAALGGVDVDGPLDGSANPGAFQLNFDEALDGLDFGSATVEEVDLTPGGDTSFLVKGSIFGNPDGEGTAALYAQTNGGDEVLVWGGEGAEAWSDYVYELTIEPADNDTVGAVFYYDGAGAYYELVLNQQDDERVLNRVEGGVVTELARETGSYRHFAEQQLKIAVIGGTITVTLDEDLLFDAPVTDPEPLAGGTVGVLSRAMDRAKYDDIAVNPVTHQARALGTTPDERWATDLDGDGTAEVMLTGAASLSATGITLYEWLVEGSVVATGETVTLDLAP